MLPDECLLQGEKMPFRVRLPKQELEHELWRWEVTGGPVSVPIGLIRGIKIKENGVAFKVA